MSRVLVLMVSLLSAQKDFGPLYALVQQLEQDYVEAAEIGAPEGLAEQAVIAAQAVDVARALGDPQVLRGVTRLHDGMKRKVPALELRDTFGALRARLNQLGHFPRVPPRAPLLSRGKAVFASACVSCHGTDGAGAGATATTLEPKPESFQLADTLNPMSPWRAYVAVTWGVAGTAMPAFEVMPDDDRWAAAFYVLSLRQPACTGIGPEVSLKEVTTSTDAELYTKYREAALPCLRRGPWK